MGIQIVKPQIKAPEEKKSNNLGTIGTLAGAALGTAIAPGAGTMLGAQIGGAAGGTAESISQGEVPDARPVVGAASSAMQRKLDLPKTDTTETLKNSLDALDVAPPQVQQEYGPKLGQAYAMSRKMRA